MSDFEQRYKTWHTHLSMIKSMIRIITSIIIIGTYIMFGYFDVLHAIIVLAGGYGLAEIVGILEEI